MWEYWARPVPSQESAPRSVKYSNRPGVLMRPMWHHLPMTLDALTMAAACLLIFHSVDLLFDDDFRKFDGAFFDKFFHDADADLVARIPLFLRFDVCLQFSLEVVNVRIVSECFDELVVDGRKFRFLVEFFAVASRLVLRSHPLHLRNGLLDIFR